MNRFCGLLLCGVLLGSPVVSAWAATPEQMAKAAALFDEAEKNYKVGDYEKALQGYKEAYVLSGEADLLFNIGQCQRKLNRNEEALRSYKTFLQERPDTPVKADVEAIIRELELAQNTATNPDNIKPEPLILGGTDTFFSVGGGLALGFGDPAPMGSGIVEAKKFEAQARLMGLNFIAGGIDAGVRIVSSPRSDQNVRSLLNITAGPTVSTAFARDKQNNGVEEVITTNTSVFAGLYGANSFYVNCNFSARGELQFAIRAVNRFVFDGVVQENANNEIDSQLFINLSAHYNLKRDACSQVANTPIPSAPVTPATPLK